MCGWKSEKKNKLRGLRMHIRQKDHKGSKKRAHLSERRDIKYEKLEKCKNNYLKCSGATLALTSNCWLFEYLGSMFQVDGDQMTDVRRRCGMAKTRVGTLRQASLVIGSLDGPKNTFVRSVMLHHPSVWIEGLAVE